MQPEFRNEDKLQRLPFRDWLRKYLPSGDQGFVVEDLDLVIRLFGSAYRLDSKGAFALIELKYMRTDIGKAQRMTFGLIDEVARLGDPQRKRYLGYFLIQYTDEDWDNASFWINYKPISKEELFVFLEHPEKYEPYDFRELVMDKKGVVRRVER
jgi:hypothetical protein